MEKLVLSSVKLITGQIFTSCVVSIREGPISKV